MTIQIKNLRLEKPVEPYDIRVDRASVLGNPYYMSDESQRELVCRKYEHYLKDKLHLGDKVFVDEINRLKEIYAQHGKLNLFCWCSPKQCHAETIKKILEDRL